MIKVLVVDGSALVRQMLKQMLSDDPEIEVVGSAQNPYIAMDKIKQYKPDVLTLDIDMQKMDGITFLRNLMQQNPLPVVMISTHTTAGADITLQALELGAIDYVCKPKKDIKDTLGKSAAEIISKVKMAASVRVKKSSAIQPSIEPSQETAKLERVSRKPIAAAGTGDMIIALGASTGGTEALKEVFSKLPATTPGTVITQHIPVAFSEPFSKRLNANSAMTVCQAEDGQKILTGHAYLAPGDRHLQVIRSGSDYICKLLDSEPVNRHKPSVEVMFHSVARNVGANALCVLFTGMGDDGADAMGVMKKAGAVTIAQNEASSVVWGMPGEAVKRGHADEVLPLNQIAERILYYISKQG